MRRRAFLTLTAVPLAMRPAQAQDPTVSLLLGLLVPIAWDILKDYLKSLPPGEAARQAQKIYASIQVLDKACQDYVTKVGAYLDSLDQHSPSAAQMEGAANAAATELFHALTGFERTAMGIGAHLQVLSADAKANLARYLDAKTHELKLAGDLARSPETRAKFRRSLAESSARFETLVRGMMAYLVQTYHVHEAK